MKRLVVCCDGTWQSLDNGWPTNVQRVAQFVMPTTSKNETQIVYYDAGVGTRGLVDKFSGGALGHGLDHEIREAYRFLALNYERDDEIYLFGYSRGAYTVRSLAGLIYSCDIVKRSKIRSIPRAMELYRDREVHPDDDESINFRDSNSIGEDDHRSKVKFLGCWDTVGALGVPDAIPFINIDNLLGRQFEFHDTNLGSHIMTARHAVAIDEERQEFDLTPMNEPTDPIEGHSLKQMWFPGTHSCVGGGIRSTRGLADGSLRWMMHEAEQIGLEFDLAETEKYTKSDPLIDFPASTSLYHFATDKHIYRDGPEHIGQVSEEAKTRWAEYKKGNKEYRPATLNRVSSELG